MRQVGKSSEKKKGNKQDFHFRKNAIYDMFQIKSIFKSRAKDQHLSQVVSEWKEESSKH